MKKVLLLIMFIVMFILPPVGFAYRDMYQDIAMSTYPKLIPNATVSVFLAGTSTPAKIYATSVSTTAIYSVTSSSDGIFTFYIDRFDYGSDQTFKIAIVKSGLTTIISDNITAYRHVLREYPIIADKTVTTFVRIPQGVTYNISSGKTLTFTLMPNYGDYTVFTGSGTAVLPASSGGSGGGDSGSCPGTGIPISTGTSWADSISPTAGSILYGDSTPAWAKLAKGAAAYMVLGMNSADTLPEWQASAMSTLTTTGSMLYASAANTLAKLTIGSAGTLLRAGASIPAYSALTMPDTITAGSVFAANSANVLAAINSTSGTKYLKNVDGTISWDMISAPGSIATDAIWDAAGDMVIGTGANTAAKLSLGTYAGQVMRINDAVTAPSWSTLTMPNTIAAGSVFAANTVNTLLAINSTTGTKYLKNADGVISWGAGTAEIPAAPGSDTQVMFNDGGDLAGNAGLIFDKTNVVLTIGNAPVADGSSPYYIPGSKLNVGLGSPGTPDTDFMPAMMVEKYSDVTGVTNYYDWGAGYFALYRKGGSAYSAALTGFAQIDSGTAGDTIGVFGFAVNSNSTGSFPHGTVGGWFRADDLTGNGSYINSAEFGVTPYSDSGHYTTGMGKQIGVWIANYGTTLPASQAIGIGSSGGKWHTGISFLEDSIVPISAGVNEAILINGGSTPANKYNGISLNSGNFATGINLMGGTFDVAIALPDLAQINMNNKNAMYANGNNLLIGGDFGTVSIYLSGGLKNLSVDVNGFVKATAP